MNDRLSITEKLKQLSYKQFMKYAFLDDEPYLRACANKELERRLKEAAGKEAGR